MSSIALREDVWTDDVIAEMERLSAAGIGKRTRTPRACYKILDFKIGERCILGQSGDTVYMVTNSLHGNKHVAYYRDKEVMWTELGRGFLTDCIKHCLNHLNRLKTAEQCSAVIKDILARIEALDPEARKQLDEKYREGFLAFKAEHCVGRTLQTESITGPTDEERFVAHLKRCSEIVANWPKWKQEILGWRFPVADRKKPDFDGDPTYVCGSAYCPHGHWVDSDECDVCSTRPALDQADAHRQADNDLDDPPQSDSDTTDPKTK